VAVAYSVAAKMPFELPMLAKTSSLDSVLLIPPCEQRVEWATHRAFGKTEKWQTFSVTLRNVLLVTRAPSKAFNRRDGEISLENGQQKINNTKFAGCTKEKHFQKRGRSRQALDERFLSPEQVADGLLHDGAADFGD
jgi:hypothetical protein